MTKKLFSMFTGLFLANVLLLASTGVSYAALERGPYLQTMTQSSVVVRWRSTNATDSRVSYGSNVGNLLTNVDVPGSTTEHEVVISGLSPNTRYYYSVGSTSLVEAGNDADHYFQTPPAIGTHKPTRIWALGDAGTGTQNQRNVRDAYYNFDINPTHTDVLLMLGDNAYNNGTDSEYTNRFFNVYDSMLISTPVWPARGNHERNLSVHEGSFTLPQNAEAGGVASGSELYFSFDHGDIHFICLDSFTSSNLNGNAMYSWLRNDLASTTQKWIIAYWHHPPYSRSSAHDSDSEVGQRVLRERAVPILEQYGVDLALAGHNHFYSRTVLINGHYGQSNTWNTNTHAVDPGDGRETGTGVYNKGTDPKGAVYILAGSSGKTGYSIINHPANFVETKVLGSVVVDVSNDRMDVKFLRDNGSTDDFFTILKVPPTNQKPAANAGTDQIIALPAGAVLDGTVVDDSLPANSVVSIAWSQVSGPGVVTFADATAADTSASFSAAGTYVLQIAANDTELSDSDTVTIQVNPPPANQAPLVNAGADQSIYMPVSANLTGSVSDDGLPIGANVTSTWSQVSGPGVATFTNANATTTTASFSVEGIYVLRLTSNDTLLSASDDITITVEPQPANVPPTVNAGVDQNAVAGLALALNGSVIDDGFPNPPGVVTSNWSTVSGPGTVTYSSPASLTSTATFPVIGTYELRLTANDGAASVSDTVTVTVAAAPVVLEAESFESGLGNWANVTLGDDESWTRDSGGTPSQNTGPSSGHNSTWYMYFETSSCCAYTSGETAILEGPSLTSGSNRSLSFYYHMYGANTGTLNVDVQQSGVWTNGVWTLSGQQQSSNLAPYQQTTVDLSNFGGIIKVRFRAVAVGNFRGDIAIDEIEIKGIQGPPVNQAPIVNISADQTVTLPNSLTLAGTVTDDGLGGALSQSWNQVSGPGTVAFGDASTMATTASFPVAGIYVLRLTASDTELSASDDIQITVNPAPVNQAPVANAGQDQTVSLSTAVNLNGSISDDGLPAGASVTSSWSQVSGPGTAVFGETSAAMTTISFPVIGTYVLRLTASDTELSASDDIQITVNEMGPPQAIEANTSDGDKQEIKNGQIGAQSFRHDGGNYSVTKVTLYLSKKSSDAPNGPLLFSIGTSVNGGTIAGTTMSIAESQVTNTSEGDNFTAFDVVFANPVSLNDGVTYYLNLDTGASNGEAYFLEYSGGNTYPNGKYYKDGSDDGKDLRFTITGTK